MKPIAENKTLGEVLAEASKCQTLKDAIGYVCIWEEYRRTGKIQGEPCFGYVVIELLKLYDIEIKLQTKRNQEKLLAL